MIHPDVVETVFKSEREDEHALVPALFTEVDLGRGRIPEPRLAVLFGITEDTPDAVRSFILELQFGGQGSRVGAAEIRCPSGVIR